MEFKDIIYEKYNNRAKITIYRARGLTKKLGLSLSQRQEIVRLVLAEI